MLGNKIHKILDCRLKCLSLLSNKMSALILPKVGCSCLSQQTSYLVFVWRVHELSNNIWIMLENEPHLNEIFRIIIKLHRSFNFW